MSLVSKIFGTHSERELKRIEPIVNKISTLRPEMQSLTDEELRGKTEEFKKRLQNGQTLDEVMKAGWDVGVAWQDGRPFHQEYGIRMNLALPLSRVKEAFERLDAYVFHV